MGKVTCIYLLFVFLKCWNDSIYIKRKHVIPTHGLEWGMVAVVATISGMWYSNSFWTVVSFDCLMLPVTWIAEDLTLNIFLVQNPFTYVGGGWWDDFFKVNFPSHTARSIWITKLGLLFVTSWWFYEVTLKQIGLSFLEMVDSTVNFIGVLTPY